VCSRGFPRIEQTYTQLFTVAGGREGLGCGAGRAENIARNYTQDENRRRSQQKRKLEREGSFFE
jgi:hypothetical protein